MLKFLNGRLLGTCIEGEVVPAGGGVVVPPPAGDAWHKEIVGEDLGYFQNRGWDKLDAKGAALAASKAHREAEKLIGAPADKIVRLPNDPADTEAWRQVRLKLGMPKDEAGYDLTVVKHADGSALTDAEKASFQKQAFKLGLRPSDALEFVNDSVKAADAGRTTSDTEAQAKLAAQKTALATNWGPNYEANMFVAKQTAAALGVTPDAIAALEKVVGYDKVMDMFRNIGTKIGEDKFIQTHLPNGGNIPMTREAAQDRKASLMKDEAWVKSYLAGDTQKAQEMTALNTMIVAQQR